MSKTGDFCREVKVKKHITDEQAGKTALYKVILGNDARDPDVDYTLNVTLKSESKSIFDEYPLDTEFELGLHASAQKKLKD